MAATTGSITSASGSTSYVRAPNPGDNLALIGISGTYSGTFVLEGAIDSASTPTFYSLLGVRLDGGASETSTGALSSTSRVWSVNIAGLTYVQIRCTAYTSGTANIILNTSPASIRVGSAPQGIDQTTPGTTDHVTNETKQYTAPVCGELQGSASALQMPSVSCKLVRFKAQYDNVGSVYIGVSGVTKADGTTDTTTGLQLRPGEDSGWIPVDNLSRFYRICDNAGDDLTYLALA